MQLPGITGRNMSSFLNVFLVYLDLKLVKNENDKEITQITHNLK